MMLIGEFIVEKSLRPVSFAGQSPSPRLHAQVVVKGKEPRWRETLFSSLRESVKSVDYVTLAQQALPV
jgi:hypothetical protein